MIRAIEDYAGTVTDPEMAKEEEDFAFIRSLRSHMAILEKFWWGKYRFPNWYKETAWMERTNTATKTYTNPPNPNV